MQKLSSTDANFLYWETENAPQHVGGIQYLEVPEAQRDTYFEDLKRVTLERLHLVPYFTSRLVETPFQWDHPVWVRDTAFEIDDHFHHLTLPHPGSIDQLELAAMPRVRVGAGGAKASPPGEGE